MMLLVQTSAYLRRSIRLAVLTLIASLATSNAFAKLPSCPTTNVLQEWKSARPDTYAKVQQEADATLNGKNIFWKIEKDDVPTSYLLGTVHVSDPRVIELPEEVSNALDSVDQVVLELSEAADPQKLNTALMRRADLMIAKPGKDVKSLIGSDHAQALDKVLRTRGMSLEGAAALSPVMVYLLLAMPPCELSRQAGGATTLDSFLGKMALDSSKKLEGLETPAEQMEMLASLPDELMAKALISSVELGQTMDDLTSTTIELYLEEDIGAIIPLTAAAIDMLIDSAKPTIEENALFEDMIITQRNRNMASRAVAYLDKIPTLIAVGALHLPGDQGLVELLKAKGYRLTPVPLSR